MADTNEWNEARIERYITDQIEESLDTEYKSAGALEKNDPAKLEITKDVSAMANSEGGIIIYGLAEHPQFKHRAGTITPINRTKISKEWLEQVISQIRPRIAGLRIFPVSLKSGQNDVAYVVEIPQGTTAHQATDKRYYRRYNFEAVPMVDYELRDVMNRVKTPRIEIELLPKAEDDGAGHVRYKMTAWVLNTSDSVTANDVTVWYEQHPPNWDFNTSVWEYVRRSGQDGKFVFKYSLHPGDRETIGHWTAGHGSAQRVTAMEYGQVRQKLDLSKATFLASEYRFRLRVFARNQPAMDFKFHFSKEEMEGQILKRFQPSKIDV